MVTALVDCHAPQATHVVIEVQSFRTMMKLLQMGMDANKNSAWSQSLKRMFEQRHMTIEYGYPKIERSLHRLIDL